MPRRCAASRGSPRCRLPCLPAPAAAATTFHGFIRLGLACPRLQVRRLAMYNSKAKRDKNGRIISQDFQSKELPNTRIQPDRRWFGNTRVIGQKQLEAFREEMGAKVADPYAVIIREKKLPLSLLEDPEKKHAGGASPRSTRTCIRGRGRSCVRERSKQQQGGGRSAGGRLTCFGKG